MRTAPSHERRIGGRRRVVEDGCARARVCSYDSSLCRAAVLMGLVSNATGGNVSVAFVSNVYTGAVTSGNGVTTSAGSYGATGFVFPGMGACAGLVGRFYHVS